MKQTLFTSAAVLALSAGTALADNHLMFAPGEGAFSWDSYNAWAESAPDLSGQTVTVAGPWLQPEDEVFRSVVAYFAEATGAEVIYTGSDSFEQQIVIDAEAGAAPNIAVFPQPGLAADMAARGLLSPLPDEHGATGSPRTMPPASPGSISAPIADADGDDQLYGFFYNVEREVAGLVRARELRGCGLRSPDDDGRAEGADRADRGRWRNAVVHRSGIGCRDRLAGHRLGRGHDAAHPAAGSL